MRDVRAIYIESRINADLNAVWEATQDPSLHRRWDVRFSEIDYLAAVPGEPQQFTYATRVVPGVTISGTGEALGDRERADGTRWSGLKFWTNDRRAVIAAGAGYWKYLPGPHADGQPGVRFLTRFDYRTRWGAPGASVDRWVFRPLFGWATAWSFDRLRIWLETGTSPEVQRNQAIAHALAVGSVAAIWVYQGLVPKVIGVDATEVGLWRLLGASPAGARILVRSFGILEIAAGVGALAMHRKKSPFVITAAVMPLLAASVGRLDRSILARAFNPVSLNFAVAALAAIAVLTADDLPSGLRPLRHAPDRQPDLEELP